jgi:Bacterial antitoxin of type II TA system, VapB
MRTTINLPDELFQEAKRFAAATGRTFTSVVEDALRATLARRDEPAGGPPVKLPTSPGAPRPGVDLDDSAALLGLMEAGDDDPL